MDHPKNDPVWNRSGIGGEPEARVESRMGGAPAVDSAGMVAGRAVVADPDTLVTIRSTRTEFEASTVAAVLEDSGIRARVFATTANWVGWEGGIGNNVRVQVRRGDVERAEAVLKKNRQDSVDLDWDQVDVGVMEDLAPEARPRFSMERLVARRHGRARVVRIGLIMIAATMLVAFLGPAAAMPVGAVACLMVWANWDHPAGRGR